MSRNSSSYSVCRFACLSIACGLCVAAFTGCDALSQLVGRPGTGELADGPSDPFEAALADAEPGEKPYVEASRPFLKALVARDYSGLYGLMSAHALRKVSKGQFLPSADENAPPAEVFENLTQEQFLEQMAKIEQTYGPPMQIDYINIDVDPEILSGRGDRFEVMMAIGGMPAEVPVEIRRAALYSRIDCNFSDAAVKQIASDLKISEEQVRAGQIPENEHGYDAEERPFFKFKFVLIDEGGQLKIGYFEFVPPSILD